MKLISERYSRLFREFYSEKAKDRFDYILRYSRFYSETFPLYGKAECMVDPLSVDAFVTSYFLDVIKFKEYHFRNILDGAGVSENGAHDDEEIYEGYKADRIVHFEKMINASKVGAFTAKWLLKYRPIAVIPKNGARLDIFNRRHIQNAPFIFATNVTLRSMGIDPDEMPEELYRSLNYHLRYRDFEDRNVMLYLELLVEHIKVLRSKEERK